MWRADILCEQWNCNTLSVLLALIMYYFVCIWWINWFQLGGWVFQWSAHESIINAMFQWSFACIVNCTPFQGTTAICQKREFCTQKHGKAFNHDYGWWRNGKTWEITRISFFYWSVLGFSKVSLNWLKFAAVAAKSLNYHRKWGSSLYIFTFPH